MKITYTVVYVSPNLIYQIFMNGYKFFTWKSGALTCFTNHSRAHARPRLPQDTSRLPQDTKWAAPRNWDGLVTVQSTLGVRHRVEMYPLTVWICLLCAKLKQQELSHNSHFYRCDSSLAMDHTHITKVAQARQRLEMWMCTLLFDMSEAGKTTTMMTRQQQDDDDNE